MTAKVFETAEALGQTIKESAEFVTLEKEYKKVFEDKNSSKLFEKFRNMQLDLQQKQMTGQQLTEKEIMKAQELVAEVQQDEKIVALMDAEQRLSGLIQEINKILTKPLEDIYGSFSK